MILSLQGECVWSPPAILRCPRSSVLRSAVNEHDCQDGEEVGIRMRGRETFTAASLQIPNLVSAFHLTRAGT